MCSQRPWHHFLQGLPKEAPSSRVFSLHGEQFQTLWTNRSKKGAIQNNCAAFESVPYENFEISFGCVSGSSYHFWHDGNDSGSCEKVTVAIPREPFDFLHRAVAAGHPGGMAISAPSDLQSLIAWNRGSGSFNQHLETSDWVCEALTWPCEWSQKRRRTIVGMCPWAPEG